GTSTASRRETIEYGKTNRLKTCGPAFRPAGEGPLRLHRGGESGARASDDSDDGALLRSHPTAVIPCRVRPGVRGTRHVCLEVGLICTSFTEKCSRRGVRWHRLAKVLRHQQPGRQGAPFHEPWAVRDED